MTDQPQILVIGGVATDLVVRVPRIPAAGEVVQGCHFVAFAGGRGATQAIAAHRAGALVTLLARVGSDDFGQRMAVALQGQGINTDALLVSEGLATGVAWHLVDHNGENATINAPGANHMLRPEDIDEHLDLFDHACALLVNLEIPQTTAAYAVARARHRGIPTIINPAPAPTDEVTPGLWQADVVIANREEIEALSGEPVEDAHAAKFAASALIAKGAATVVVTLGRRGALAIHAETIERIPPFPVGVVDVTGAGDAFCGAFAAAWSRCQQRDTTQALRETTRFAAAAGALACQKFGRQNSMPHLADIERLIIRSC